MTISSVIKLLDLYYNFIESYRNINWHAKSSDPTGLGAVAWVNFIGI